MKIFLFILFVSTSFINGQDERVNSNDLVMRDGILYKLDDYVKYGVPGGYGTTSVPYTGKVFTLNSSPREYGTYVLREYSVRNGLKHGRLVEWYKSGEKELEESWEDGILDGLWKTWREDGTKSLEIIFKDGKEISRKQWGSDGKLNYSR